MWGFYRAWLLVPVLMASQVGHHCQLPIVVSVVVLGHEWRDCTVCCCCGNAAVVVIIREVIEGPNSYVPNAVSVFLHCTVPDCVSSSPYSRQTQRSCTWVCTNIKSDLTKPCSSYYRNIMVAMHVCKCRQ